MGARIKRDAGWHHDVQHSGWKVISESSQPWVDVEYRTRIWNSTELEIRNWMLRLSKYSCTENVGRVKIQVERDQGHRRPEDWEENE